MSRQIPTAEEAARASNLLLDAIEARTDIAHALGQVRPLHPNNNTFPGEIFMRLAARALAEGGVSPTSPISQEGSVARYLPDAGFRGRENQKMRFALLAGAATHAGVEVDLLDEVSYWDSDDFWYYAGLAAAVWVRAVAESRHIPLSELVHRLRTED